VDNLQKAQENVKNLIQNLQGDITNSVELDLVKVKQRFLKEKKDIENLLNTTVLGEIKKAQTYIDTQKKELVKIQDRLEKYIKQEKTKAKKTIQKKLGKKTKKKTAKKATSAKKKV
jgi:CRISPR/Cas system-associated exonuclease Cas4 (RecB family)